MEKKIQRVEKIKYLGVIFDEKNNWKEHIEHVIRNAKMGMYATRNLTSKKWGLKPKRIEWIHKQMIIPRITYGCIIWWHKTKSNKTKSRLGSLQREVINMITGCVRSTPNMALNAALNMAPLHLKIEEAASKAFVRLKRNNMWVEGGLMSGHKSIATKMGNIEGINLQRSEDETMDVERKYEVVINEARIWNRGVKTKNNYDCWYVDGSKKNEEGQIGLYNDQRKNEICMGTTEATINRIEREAISQVTQWYANKVLYNREIVIATDSRGTLLSLLKDKTEKEDIGQLNKNLNKLSERNKVTLVWCPKSRKIKGNCKAHKIPRRGKVGKKYL